MGMVDRQSVERAETLAEMAPDDSVTVAVLAGFEGRFTSATPLAEPPVTYLEDAEAPAYVLTNGKRGIGLGSKRNTVSPARDRRTVLLVTGRRTLCLVGGDSEDEVISVPHESVAQVEYHTGFRRHRLVLRTPRQLYHCWVHRRVNEQLLAATTEFIEDRRPDEAQVMDTDEANVVMYRGRPVRLHSGATDPEPTDSEQTIRYRGQPVDDES